MACILRSGARIGLFQQHVWAEEVRGCPVSHVNRGGGSVLPFGPRALARAEGEVVLCVHQNAADLKTSVLRRPVFCKITGWRKHWTFMRRLNECSG